jgi:hypothetical protein
MRDIRAFWEMMAQQTTDPKLVIMLFESALTLSGALILSISAGGWRGWLFGSASAQVRDDMAFHSLRLLHAYQYGWDALLSVFLAGMALPS